jgi:cytochrome c553
MTKSIPLQPLALALLASLALAACSSGETPAAHAPAEGAEAHASSSAGLPDGRAGIGETLANTKQEATGQACVDCHGAGGNAPIDASYPKLGGQYRDYLAHSLQMYRDGGRSHALMASQAKGLTDQQIADLAAYFAAQPSELRDLSDL